MPIDPIIIYTAKFGSESRIMKTVALANQVTILFLLMLVGFIARKKHILNNELNSGITEILINITVPFMIVSSFNLRFSPSIFHYALILFLAAVFVHVFSAIIGLVLYIKYPKSERKILLFSTIFSNTGFMGLPVLGSLFGPLAVFYGSMYVVVFNIFVWTLGVKIFTGKDVKLIKAFTNPALVGVLLGSILFFFSIKLPVPVIKTVDMIGATTTPLSMLVIGSMLADTKPKELFAGLPVYYGTLARLLIIPLIMVYLLRFLGISGHLLKICITSTAMPVATMTAIFAEKYNGDVILASRLVFISTALSLLTIPFVVMLI
jgi:predicted permease